MKCVLVLSLVALCYAEVPLKPSYAKVPLKPSYAEPLKPTTSAASIGEDGTITVIGTDGKKIVISNSVGSAGRKNVEISVPDLFGITRTIKVNQDYNVRTTNIDDPTNTWYGVKPVSDLYQGPVYSDVSPFWYKGLNGAGLEEYRDFYGPRQQSTVQQKWQPAYEPYQQQEWQTLQQSTLPQQQWTLPQSWSLPKQQLSQDQFLWNQMQGQQRLTVPQQLTQPRQMLTQPQEQLNFLLPKRQMLQEQYYGPQQQYYGPQQQNIGIQGYQQENIPAEQLWGMSERQGLPWSRGQQIQSSVPLGNYWQRLWAPKMQFPVNLPVV